MRWAWPAGYWFLLAAGSQTPAMAQAQPAPPVLCGSTPGPTSSGPPQIVTAILDDQTLRLADGGTVRLAAILAPARVEGAPAQPTAADAVKQLALGQSAQVLRVGPGRDRHGHQVGHVVVVRSGQSPVWLQDRLVADGLARVASTADTAACLPQLLSREDEARRARRGLWAMPAFAVRSAWRSWELRRERHTFQIVAGRVRSVETVAGGATRLRLARQGPDAFSLLLARADAEPFTARKLSLASLQGRLLRVRGWIEVWGGRPAGDDGRRTPAAPMVRLTHPEQIEVLP